MIRDIITTSEGIIIAIGENAIQSPLEADVILMNGAGYGIRGQKLYKGVTIPSGVEASIYTYDGTVFSPYLSEVDRIKQEAIDAYTLELIEGGLI